MESKKFSTTTVSLGPVGSKSLQRNSSAKSEAGGLTVFKTNYEGLCARRSRPPVCGVLDNLCEAVLDIDADRFDDYDWDDLLEALEDARDFQFIAIRSFHRPTKHATQPILNSVEKSIAEHILRIQLSNITNGNSTVKGINTDFTMDRIVNVLAKVIATSDKLFVLELENLDLKAQHVSALYEGMKESKSLKHISFEQSPVGDPALILLCRLMREGLPLTSINLSGCELTWRAMDSLGEFIKYQSNELGTEIWKESLRYGTPDLDSHGCLRRISLNDNPKIGDKGACILSDSLQDDAWIRAVDLQNCNISDSGVKFLLKMLKSNTTMVILDVRENPICESKLLVRILQQLAFNAQDDKLQFKWLKLKPDQCMSERKTKPERFGSCPDRIYNPCRKKNMVQKGIPWRASTRMAIRRGGTTNYIPGITCNQSKESCSNLNYETVICKRPPDYPDPDCCPEIMANSRQRHSDLEYELANARMEIDTLRRSIYRNNCVPPCQSPCLPDPCSIAPRQTTRAGCIASVMEPSVRNQSCCPPNMVASDACATVVFEKVMRILECKLEDVLEMLDDERCRNKHINAHVRELECENKMLRQHLGGTQPEGNGGMDIDSDIMNAIEQTLAKLDCFLETLDRVGLGSLIAAAGIDNNTVKDLQAQLNVNRPGGKSMATFEQQPGYPTTSQPYEQTTTITIRNVSPGGAPAAVSVVRSSPSHSTTEGALSQSQNPQEAKGSMILGSQGKAGGSQGGSGGTQKSQGGSGGTQKSQRGSGGTDKSNSGSAGTESRHGGMGSTKGTPSGSTAEGQIDEKIGSWQKIGDRGSGSQGK